MSDDSKEDEPLIKKSCSTPFESSDMIKEEDPLVKLNVTDDIFDDLNQSHQALERV